MDTKVATSVAKTADEMGINPQNAMKYSQKFDENDRDRDGYLSG